MQLQLLALRRITLVISVLFPSTLAHYSHQLHDVDSSVLVGASQSCLDAYNANVSCPSSIGYLYTDRFPDLASNALAGLCTRHCFHSLLSHRNQVASACGSSIQYYNDADGSFWPGTYLDDAAIYGYNLTCLKRGYLPSLPQPVRALILKRTFRSGEYCNTWLQSARNSSSASECDKCYLETALAQANSPAEADAAEMRSIYSSMSASCSYNGPPACTVASLVLSS
jgi:hypothetical protein